jgi:hypothetical protein
VEDSTGDNPPARRSAVPNVELFRSVAAPRIVSSQGKDKNNGRQTLCTDDRGALGSQRRGTAGWRFAAC